MGNGSGSRARRATLSGLAVVLALVVSGCYVAYFSPDSYQATIGEQVLVVIYIDEVDEFGTTIGPAGEGISVLVQVQDATRAQTAVPSSQTLYTDSESKVTFAYTNSLPGVDTIVVPLIDGEPWGGPDLGDILALESELSASSFSVQDLNDQIDLESIGYPATVEWLPPASTPNTQVTARNQSGGPTLNLQASVNRNGVPSGSFSYHHPPVRLTSRHIDSVVRSGDTAMIYGSGHLADGTEVTYQLEVTSGGRSRTGHRISLTVSNGYSVQNVPIANVTIR